MPKLKRYPATGGQDADRGQRLTSSIMACKEPWDKFSTVARAVRAVLAAAVAWGSFLRVAANAGSSSCLSQTAHHHTTCIHVDKMLGLQSRS